MAVQLKSRALEEHDENSERLDTSQVPIDSNFGKYGKFLMIVIVVLVVLILLLKTSVNI